jgi:hypothetical protein
VELNETPTRAHADAVHDPGGETDTPGSLPLSVRLEGERNKAMSLYVKANDVRTVDYDHNTQQLPRRPVGTPDGDKCRPNEPTEPPNKEEGAR